MSNQKLSLEDLGQPIFTSRSSEVFNWDEEKLLKLFHAGTDPDLIAHEAINSQVTFESGVSRVEYCGQVQLGDRQGLILKRVAGKTLISLAAGRPQTVFSVHRLMADLQIALHQAESDRIRSYRGLAKEALDREPMEFLTPEEKAHCLDRLEALPEGKHILHLDYHPDNIMSDGKSQTTIIDWMTASAGVPAADVAATLFLLNEGEMIPGMSKLAGAALEAIRKTVCRKYYADYKKKTGLTDQEVARWRLPFLIFRLTIWNIDSEIPGLQRKIREELAK